MDRPLCVGGHILLPAYRASATGCTGAGGNRRTGSIEATGADSFSRLRGGDHAISFAGSCRTTAGCLHFSRYLAWTDSSGGCCKYSVTFCKHSPARRYLCRCPATLACKCGNAGRRASGSARRCGASGRTSAGPGSGSCRSAAICAAEPGVSAASLSAATAPAGGKKIIRRNLVGCGWDFVGCGCCWLVFFGRIGRAGQENCTGCIPAGKVGAE